MNPVKPLDWLRAAMDDDRLTTTQRAAVAGIARRAPGKEQPNRFADQVSGWDFYLSRNELACLMNASVPTAERCLTRLLDLGMLEKVSRGGHRGRGERVENKASVWRLAIPQSTHNAPRSDVSNPSLVMSWNDVEPLTGDDMEEGSNPSETHLPTHQKDSSNPSLVIHQESTDLQESAVLQESSADAHLLTQVIVDENHINSEGGTGSTQFPNSTTDRARIQVWGQGEVTDAWIS